MNIYRFILMIILLIMVTLAYSETEISKQSKISPVRMTYDDLSIILDDVKALLHRTNEKFSGDGKSKITLDVSAGEDTINIQGWEVLSNIKGLPKVARSVRFRYSLFYAPISNLEITLTDSYRVLSVSGSDSSQVYAISSYLKDKFNNHNTYFGGLYFRMIGAGVLWLVLLTSAITFTHFYTHRSAPNSGNAVLIGAFPNFVWIITIFVIPWDTWFPGAAIYAESASFLDRNINMISFIGVLATIAIPLAGVIIQRKKKQYTTKH